MGSSEATKAMNAMSAFIKSDKDSSIVHETFLTYILSRTTTPSATAADMIAICSSESVESAENTAYDIAYFLSEMAMELPFLRSCIAPLVVEINALMDQRPESHASYPQAIDAVARGFAKHFYFEIPNDYMNTYYENRGKQERSENLDSTWQTLNGFMAAYVAWSHVRSSSASDYWNIGHSLTILSRLEENFEEQDNVELNADADIPAAGAWFLEAGNALASNCSKSDSTASDSVNDVRGPLWKGSRDFSPERWAFWKARFEVARHLDFVRENTRQTARSVVIEMGRIEQSDLFKPAGDNM